MNRWLFIEQGNAVAGALIKNIDSQLTGFSLQLSDNTRWWLGSDNNTANWLHQFAAILGLPPCKQNDEIYLIFHSGTLQGEREPCIETELNCTNPSSIWTIHQAQCDAQN